MREQFPNTFAAEMAVFLEERVPELVEKIVRLEYYKLTVEKSQGRPQTASISREQHKTDPKADMEEKKCFLGHRTGHLAKECKSVKPSKSQ